MGTVSLQNSGTCVEVEVETKFECEFEFDVVVDVGLRSMSGV